MNLQFQATGKQSDANLKIDFPAGSTNATLSYDPANQAYMRNCAAWHQARSAGNVKARDLQLQGVLDVNASGKGTLKIRKCKQ